MMKYLMVLLGLALTQCCFAEEPLKQGTCPQGFLTFAGDKCFHVSTDYIDGLISAVTWDQARELCLAKSNDKWTADLAYSINEDTIYQFSRYIAANHTDMSYYIFWVGALRASAASHWEWTDGLLSDAMSYVWLLSYPNAQSQGTRGMLVPAGAHNRFYMIDYVSTAVGPSFICEAAPKCNRS